MKFHAPKGSTVISRESDVYPVKDGVVDLPASLGAELALVPAEGDKPAKPAKGKDAEGDKPAKDDGKTK